MTANVNLVDFLQEKLTTNTTNDSLRLILNDVASAAIQIASAIDKGALEGNMGSLEAENVQGEVQKALDVITNDIFIETCQQSGCVAGMASEEMQDIIPVENVNAEGPHYLLLFDPLDGSSNVNVNISVGTIFSVLPTETTTPEISDFLQAGDNQVLAGYVLYGTSTMLVLKPAVSLTSRILICVLIQKPVSLQLICLTIAFGRSQCKPISTSVCKVKTA